MIFNSSRSAKLNITIILPGSKLPLRVRGGEFSIIDQTMEEILLGRPFLNAIAFNLTEHLERVHEQINDKHIDEID